MGRKLRNRDGGQKVRPHDDPMVVYITAIPPMSLAEVAKLFEGRRGCSFQGLMKRSAAEGWTEKRREYQAETRRLALDEIARDSAVVVARANERHIKFGEDLENVSRIGLAAGARRIKQVVDGNEEMDIKTAAAVLRMASQVGRTGVDVNRKGLGLADKIVFVKNIREVTTTFVRVLENVLSGHPDLLAVALSEIKKELSTAESEAVSELEDA